MLQTLIVVYAFLLGTVHSKNVAAPTTGTTKLVSMQGTSPLRLNQDFSLRPEIDELDNNNLESLDFNTRVRWQMRRYRQNPTFGLLENKLLSHSLLRRLEIPQLDIYYGAFARKNFGDWPQYNRQDFIQTMHQTKAVVEDHLFVLKPISDGGFQNILIMNHRKWINEEWTVEKMADFAESFLFKPYSGWGLKYEHMGVMVQQSILTNDDNFDASFDGVMSAVTGTNPEKASDVIEFKVHVVFGQLTGAQIMSVPCYGELNVEVAFCGESRPYHVVTNEWWKPLNGTVLLNIVQPRINTEQLQSIASRIATAYASDWFRLDVFLDKNGQLYVNEVTYPSHNQHTGECTLSWLYEGYQQENMEIVNSTDIMTDLLSRIGISYTDFVEQSDFHVLEKLGEAEYDNATWKWEPPAGETVDTKATKWLFTTMELLLKVPTPFAILLALAVTLLCVVFGMAHILTHWYPLRVAGPLFHPMVEQVQSTDWSSPLPSLSFDRRLLLKCTILLPFVGLASMWVSAHVFYILVQHWDQFPKQAHSFFCLAALMFVFAVLYQAVNDICTLCMLKRGLQSVDLPKNVDRLAHAIVIPQYKEPLDVLDAAVQSLAENTLAKASIFVLACEARDMEALDKFSKLKSKYGNQFGDFIMTNHKLLPGEAAGKGSNENYACRELYSYAQTKKIDPFRLMVTICDADSLFDRYFLEQLESEFCKQPDGRRCLYYPSTCTTRNASLCNFFVQVHEIDRTFGWSFGLERMYSNYALTLGYLNEIDYWDPSVLAEDCCLFTRACAMGNGDAHLVRVWSVIFNDAVSTFSELWTQSIRHSWGIELINMVAIYYPKMRFHIWISLLFRCVVAELSAAVPGWLFCLMPTIFNLLTTSQSMQRLACLALVWHLWQTARTLCGYFAYVGLVTKHRNRYVPFSDSQTALLWLTGAFALPFVQLIFNTATKWDRMIYATNHVSMTYITAPKQLHAGPSSKKDKVV